MATSMIEIDNCLGDLRLVVRNALNAGATPEQIATTINIQIEAYEMKQFDLAGNTGAYPYNYPKLKVEQQTNE